MNNRAWLDNNIINLIEKAGENDFLTVISEANVLAAKELIKINAYSQVDFFVILASINLLNAEIKGNVSRILHYLISLEFNKYELDFYINPTERCAYIEIYGLQFSFHNININDTINVFIDSDKNKKNLGKG